MSASSPGPDDKSGITEIKAGGSNFFVQRTVSAITVFDYRWNDVLSQVNLGQSDAIVTLVMEAYQVGWARGKKYGWESHRQELLRMLSADKSAKEEG